MAVAVAKVLAERRTDKNNVSSLMTRKTVSRTLSYNAYACFLHGCVPNTDIARALGISAQTVWRYLKQRSKQPKTMKVLLYLAVENNSKFVRGKNKSRAEIERSVLSRYQMEKLSPEGWEYHLTIPYETDEELERIIYADILREAEQIADRRHGFIEADVRSLEDPDRSW